MIRCERLGKRYERRWLFRNLRFEVQAGECLVVLGPNGSGKSTLLKILAGVMTPTEGACERDGERRTSIGYAALDQSVYPVLTVAEHLELAAELRGCNANVEALLEEVELSYASNVAGSHLSTGMRARLKLALAVQAAPAAILLDEPNAGLDERGRDLLDRMIRARLDSTAFVLATNDEQERRYATHEFALGA